MGKEMRLMTAAVAGIVLAPAAQAALYSSTTTPFDLTLDTGSYAWVNNTATLGSTRSNTNGTQNFGPELVAVSAPMVETVVPQVGVPGYVKVYDERTTRTYDRDYDFKEETLRIEYSDSIAGVQSSPSSYQLSGTISRQAGTEPGAALTFDFLNFDLGLGVDFGAAAPPSGLTGGITFEITDSLGTWNYAFSSGFDSALDSVGLSNAHALDFSEDVSFLASYSVNGLSGVDYDISDITLNVTAANADLTFGVEYNELFDTQENILSMTEIPALEPVPLPASAWLFISALGGLVTVGRSKRTGRAESVSAFSHDALLP